MSKMKKALLSVAIAVLGTGSAWGLDVNEVAQLVRSGVQDSVIINMVQSQKLDRPLTTNDVLQLSSAGASPSLLEYMTRPEAVSGGYVASPAAPVIVEQPPIQVQSPTVVTAPYSANCGATTYAVPTYVNPTYIYPYSYPSYYSSYPYRYRYGPSYSFSFGWGGGHRWGGRRHGGGGHRRGGGRRR